MNKEDNLIYEAYLNESYIKTVAMSMLCAIGLGTGCLTPPDRPQPSFDDRLNYNLDIIKHLLQIFESTNLTPEQHNQLQADLEAQLLNGGVPSDGWVAWFTDWLGKNVKSDVA